MADAYGMNYGGGGGDNMGSPGVGSPGGEVRRKPTDEKTVIPATINMLVSASQNNNIFDDGREPDQVKLVAAVRDVIKGSTAYTYRVEDGTGCIDVKEWIDSEDNIETARMREEAAVENTYVRIFGKLNSYDGKAQIVAHCFRKVSCGNELTHHFLETVHAAETHQRSNSIVGTPSGVNTNLNFNNEVMGNGNGMQTSTPIGNGGGSGNFGSDNLSRDIEKYLQDQDQEQGGSVNEFVGMFGNQYPEQDIRQKFEYLATEGMIYSTIDDDRYSII